MSDTLFDIGAYTQAPKSFKDYDLDTEGWDDTPPLQSNGNSRGNKFNVSDRAIAIEPCSPSLTCAVESEPDSLSPLPILEYLTSLDCASVTNSVGISSLSDSPTPESCQMSESSPQSETCPPLISLPPVPLASPSALKESNAEQETSEIVSPLSWEQLTIAPPDSLPSKTSQDCSIVPTPRDLHPYQDTPITNPAHILHISYGTFTRAGTMSNGLISAAPDLPRLGSENAYSWLVSHGGLSSKNSRAPGLSKSENNSKKRKILGQKEVYNPDWLELNSTVPVGWTSPLESRAATVLIGLDVWHLVTHSIQESLPLPFNGYSILIPWQSPESDCTLPAQKHRKRGSNKKPASGSLTRNVVKKGKEYYSWQYNYDVRDPSTKKGWRTVKEGVPRFKAPLVADAIKEGRPIREILLELGKEPRGEINE